MANNTKTKTTYTLAELEHAFAELKKLRGPHWKLATHYINAEMRRRKSSNRNGGRPATFDDPKHEASRAAAARYYTKKKNEREAKAKAAIAASKNGSK